MIADHTIYSDTSILSNTNTVMNAMISFFQTKDILIYSVLLNSCKAILHHKSSAEAIFFS